MAHMIEGNMIVVCFVARNSKYFECSTKCQERGLDRFMELGKILRNLRNE